MSQYYDTGKVKIGINYKPKKVYQEDVDYKLRLKELDNIYKQDMALILVILFVLFSTAASLTIVFGVPTC